MGTRGGRMDMAGAGGDWLTERRLRRERGRARGRRIAAVAWPTFAVVAVLLLAVVTQLDLRPLADRVGAWFDPPSTAITAIAERTAMTDDAAALFYGTKPSLETRATFSQHCSEPGLEADGHNVLGCFKPGEHRIYVFTIDAPELDGINEVTAAHEMLHAAWERLDASERARLTPLLEDAFARVADDELRETIADYEANGISERVNELHSYLGTEFADLGPELEEHYAEYFTNRQAVVDLNSRYEGVLDEQQRKVAELRARIDELNASIEERGARLDADIAASNARMDALDQQARAVSTPEQLDAYLAAVDEANAAVPELNRRRDELNADIDACNALIDEYNGLAVAVGDLYAAMDSAPDAAQPADPAG